jgi:GNAT superfamily N-acetyltransferase
MTFVNRSLARQLEMCHARRGIEYARAKAQLHPECGVRIESACGGQAIYAGASSPLNRVVGMGFDRTVNLDDLECVEAFFESKDVAPRIDICPLSDKTLIEALRQNNYEIESFQNILIHSLNDELNFQLPKTLEVRQSPPEEANLWILTTAQGFEETEVPSQETLDILAPNFHARNGICFLAWYAGEPAGGGGMYLHEEIAEFGGASTRIAYRRRGIQTALLHTRKAAARSQGCNIAMVVTDPGSNSQRNLETLGFHLAYTKVIMVKRSRA